jgi:hypothetical protein
MPSVFFISPFQPPIWDGNTDLLIDVTGYVEALSNSWKNAETIIVSQPQTYVASWQLPTGNGSYIEGGLQVGQNVVSCTGSLQDVANFALWHRQFIADQCRLFFFDDGLHVSIEITGETTQSEIVDAILK